jgi:hypothetical protein
MTALVTDEAASLLRKAAASADGLVDYPVAAPELIDGLLRSGLLSPDG